MDWIDAVVLPFLCGHIQWSGLGCGALPGVDDYRCHPPLTRCIHDFPRHHIQSGLPGAWHMCWPREWMPVRPNFGSCYQLLHYKAGDRNWAHGLRLCDRWDSFSGHNTQVSASIGTPGDNSNPGVCGRISALHCLMFGTTKNYTPKGKRIH